MIGAASPVDVEAVHFSSNLALLTNGEVVPITHWFGHAGVELPDHIGAVSFVAGPLENSTWLTGCLSGFGQPQKAN